MGREEGGGRGRLIASLAANPRAVEGVFVRGREFCHAVGVSTRCEHRDCAPYNPDPHKVIRFVLRHLLLCQKIFFSKYRDGLKGSGNMRWQAGERNFFTSYLRNLGSTF